jgi:hypothetical protein
VVSRLEPWRFVFDRNQLTENDAAQLPIFPDQTPDPDDIAAIQAAATEAVMAGGRIVVEEFGAEILASFNLSFPEASEYLADYGAARVVQIDDTTRRRIQNLVTRAVDDGWSWEKTAKEIIANYADMAGPPLRGGPSWLKSRAHLIAVTEVGDAYEVGSRSGAKGLQELGLVMEKRYAGPNDSRTSSNCRANLGDGWIDIDAEFTDQCHSYASCRAIWECPTYV